MSDLDRTDDPWEELAARVQQATPARIFIGRAGTSYRTVTSLRLRADHAAARDAVAAELTTDPTDLLALTGGRPAVTVTSAATTRALHLSQPELGRRLSDEGRVLVSRLRPAADLQLVLGDGLSARALTEQAPGLLGLLLDGAAQRGWSMGDLIVVRQCRVGIMNDVGELLDPRVVVLLIGERPGLATASSLSAYLAHRPRAGDTDDKRNLVANVHGRGLTTSEAAARVLALADELRRVGRSGVSIKEQAPGVALTSGE